MPLPVERLSDQSHNPSVEEAISASIEQCMREGGKTQAECAAIAYDIARGKTGKPLSFGGQR